MPLKWGVAKNTIYIMEGRPKLWSFFLILVEQKRRINMKPIAYNQKDVFDMTLVNDETKEVYEGKYIAMRLDMSTIPESKNGYKCRHDDD